MDGVDDVVSGNDNDDEGNDEGNDEGKDDGDDDTKDDDDGLSIRLLMKF